MHTVLFTLFSPGDIIGFTIICPYPSDKQYSYCCPDACEINLKDMDKIVLL